MPIEIALDRTEIHWGGTNLDNRTVPNRASDGFAKGTTVRATQEASNHFSESLQGFFLSI
jgi:hypothetical protein